MYVICAMTIWNLHTYAHLQYTYNISKILQIVPPFGKEHTPNLINNK